MAGLSNQPRYGEVIGKIGWDGKSIIFTDDFNKFIDQISNIAANVSDTDALLNSLSNQILTFGGESLVVSNGEVLILDSFIN